jgi:hypothetical protein
MHEYITPNGGTAKYVPLLAVGSTPTSHHRHLAINTSIDRPVVRCSRAIQSRGEALRRRHQCVNVSYKFYNGWSLTTKSGLSCSKKSAKLASEAEKYGYCWLE